MILNVLNENRKDNFIFFLISINIMEFSLSRLNSREPRKQKKILFFNNTQMVWNHK